MPCTDNQYLLTFESGTDGVNVTTNALTPSVYGPAGFYFTSPISPIVGMSFSSSGQKNLVNLFSPCGGASQSGAGTLGVYSSATNAGSDFFSFFTPTNSSKMSAGCWYYHTFPNTDLSANDTFMVQGINAGSFANCKLLIAPSGTHKMFELEVGGGTNVFYGNVSHITNNTWYWVTILYHIETNYANHQIWIYNADDTMLNQITSGIACSVPTNANRVLIGVTNNKIANDYGVYYDNLKVDYSPTPVFPLLP